MIDHATMMQAVPLLGALPVFRARPLGRTLDENAPGPWMLQLRFTTDAVTSCLEVAFNSEEKRDLMLLVLFLEGCTLMLT